MKTSDSNWLLTMFSIRDLITITACLKYPPPPPILTGSIALICFTKRDHCVGVCVSKTESASKRDRELGRGLGSGKALPGQQDQHQQQQKTLLTNQRLIDFIRLLASCQGLMRLRATDHGMQCWFPILLTKRPQTSRPSFAVGSF